MISDPSFDPRLNGSYLRKRFAERLWDSELLRMLDKVDPDLIDPLISEVVEGLLMEAGIE